MAATVDNIDLRVIIGGMLVILPCNRTPRGWKDLPMAWSALSHVIDKIDGIRSSLWYGVSRNPRFDQE
ncbi:hypothetical protein AAMO2058_000120700 [Amorphochlora amoebiformis]